MTSNTAVHPLTAIKPTRARYFLVAVAGVGTSVLTTVVAAVLLAAPQNLGTMIGLIVGTLVVGQLLQAKTVKRWAFSFGVVFLGQLLLGTAVIVVLMATI